MVRTAWDALVTALENLEKKGLKKFRNKLNDWPIKEGFSKIPRGQIEDRCPDDVANKIRDFYTFPYGIEVALDVLEAIDEKEVAAGLRADLRNGKRPTNETWENSNSCNSWGRVTISNGRKVPLFQPLLRHQCGRVFHIAIEVRRKVLDGFVFEQQREETYSGVTCKVTPPLPEPTREHFVIEHREALISRMSQVESFLDTLLQKKLLTYEQYDAVYNKPTSQETMRELYSHARSWGDTDKDIFYEALKKHNAPLIRDLERA
ncbi:apoptosis-associated speck-like protein containing a CARD [Pseudophryne corroboree]|uniref:apoptosis-associated speck-like protein containing a CARD n=1 Tax=Pseudophryne corroboree TaxID=495146 RepID=UPI003082070E